MGRGSRDDCVVRRGGGVGGFSSSGRRGLLPTGRLRRLRIRSGSSPGCSIDENQGLLRVDRVCGVAGGLHTRADLYLEEVSFRHLRILWGCVPPSRHGVSVDNLELPKKRNSPGCLIVSIGPVAGDGEVL